MEHERRRPFHKIFKFSTKLIIALSLANLVIACITGFITYRIHLSLFNDEVSRQYFLTTEQVLARLDSRVNDMYKITDYITLNPGVHQAIVSQNQQNSDYEQMKLEQLLDKQLIQVRLDAPEMMGIRIYDLNENRINLGTYSGSFNNFKPGYLDTMLKKLEGTGGEYVWDWPAADDYGQTNSTNMVMAGRLMRSIELDTYGMMLILFHNSLFESHLKDLRVHEKADAYLFDQSGRLLYALNGSADLPPLDFSFIPNNSNLVREEQGISYMYTKQRSEKVGFTLVSKVSLAQIQSKSKVIMQVAVASAFASLILLGVIIAIVSRLLLRPLGSLVRGMRHVREGKFDARVQIRTKDELGFLGDSFNAMTGQIEKLIFEVYERKLNEKEAELKAIQAQLNPHFLYNTLGMFFWKFYMLGDEKSAGLVNSMSEMLQYTLEPVKQQTTLRDELHQIRNYLDIQKARYREALSTEIEIADELLDCRVFRLVMQPIVENSMIHAFRNKKSDRRVRIHGYALPSGQEDGVKFLILEISDNGSGMSREMIAQITSESEPANGNDKRRFIGTRSVIRRIELLYGAPYGVELHSQLGEGTMVRLKLPFSVTEVEKEQ
ncbi:hypothetical protein B1748_15660 [Paenibacillus sp. MY03]|uniref:cache domain-containing sensor histidine kinase n=1 Tax=Paenibacillus sp. MY03 TaxID=302980 RepID=UPI000B3C9574|nr:sensor histidine kinase [Paenibacillus sp. MY03]OUS75862.1 hypothetical protein B1748_15660 [Paenibacillus sp. MY03]